MNYVSILIKDHWVAATGKDYLAGRVLQAEADMMSTSRGQEFSGFYTIEDQGRPWFIHQSRVVVVDPNRPTRTPGCSCVDDQLIHVGCDCGAQS